MLMTTPKKFILYKAKKTYGLASEPLGHHLKLGAWRSAFFSTKNASLHSSKTCRHSLSPPPQKKIYIYIHMIYKSPSPLPHLSKSHKYDNYDKVTYNKERLLSWQMDTVDIT